MVNEITSAELGLQIADEFNLRPDIGAQIVDFCARRIRQHVQEGRRVELRRFVSLEQKTVAARKWRLVTPGGETVEGETPEHLGVRARVSKHFLQPVGDEGEFDEGDDIFHDLDEE